MVDATHISFRADDRSYFAILKKEIHKQAVDSGYSQNKIAQIDIIVSELTSNLHKHASGGEFLFANFKDDSKEYMEFIAIDNGPGIVDLPRMVQDGASTTNTLGQGLGSIRRLSDTFDIYSQKDWGTIAMSRVFKESDKLLKVPNFDIRSIVVNKPGETVSGDGTYYKVTKDYLKILVGDGLGHGPDANKAVNEAVKAFKVCPFHTPVEILQFLHTAILKTRGIVGAVLIYSFAEKTWSIAGIGNIACKIMNGLSYKNIMSYNGIIGHNIPNRMDNQIFYESDYFQFIACSDGMKSRWEAAKYPSINKCDLTILAAAIYKDYARKTDDMSVVVGKIRS